MGMFDFLTGKINQIEESEESRQERLAREAAEAAEMKRVDDVLRNVILFPGSKAELEEFLGFPCFIIDPCNQYPNWIGVSHTQVGRYPKDNDVSSLLARSFDSKKYLVKNRIVAIVNAQAHNCGPRVEFSGLPVGRKQEL